VDTTGIREPRAAATVEDHAADWSGVTTPTSNQLGSEVLYTRADVDHGSERFQHHGEPPDGQAAEA
jgi:hypothetical protein